MAGSGLAVYSLVVAAMDNLVVDEDMNVTEDRVADHDNQSPDEPGGTAASGQSEDGNAIGLFGSGSEAEDDGFEVSLYGFYSRLTHLLAAKMVARSVVSSMMRIWTLLMVWIDLIALTVTMVTLVWKREPKPSWMSNWVAMPSPVLVTARCVVSWRSFATDCLLTPVIVVFTSVPGLPRHRTQGF